MTKELTFQKKRWDQRKKILNKLARKSQEIKTNIIISECGI